MQDPHVYSLSFIYEISRFTNEVIFFNLGRLNLNVEECLMQDIIDFGYLSSMGFYLFGINSCHISHISPCTKRLFYVQTTFYALGRVKALLHIRQKAHLRFLLLVLKKPPALVRVKFAISGTSKNQLFAAIRTFIHSG